METKTNIAKAIIRVMNDVKGIEKNMTVGSGNNSYKGVSDKDVKLIIGESMASNGLCILPIETTPKIQIDRWESVDYNGKPTVKQSIFTEVTTKYLLLHESGESIELSGYGQGVDSQDKGAGKATTYALKNALLYTFLVPTGKIEDTDNTHSDNIPVPQKAKQELTKEQVEVALAKLIVCGNLEDLKLVYKGLTVAEQTNKEIISEVTKLKKSFDVDNINGPKSIHT